RVLGQRFVIVVFRGAGGQFDECLRSPVTLAAVVVQQATPDGLVGSFLIGLAYRRIDAKALGIGLLGVLVVDGLAHHFGQKLAMDSGKVVDFPTDMDGSLGRVGVLLVGYVLERSHAPQHVLLALAGTLRISNRVV